MLMVLAMFCMILKLHELAMLCFLGWLVKNIIELFDYEE